MKVNKPPANISLQINAVKRFFPSFRHKIFGNDEIIFTGELQPKLSLPVYTISIHYRGNKSPIVKIISPALVEKPPHFYHDTQSICLYKPSNFKWEANKLIAKVTIPWTAAWIYFYELWLQNGNVWEGPEAIHEISEPKESEKY
jgi:hypothetical protein